jgi:adenylate cyclase
MQNQRIPAIEAEQQAIRLSPLDPLAWMFAAGLAFAHLAAGRYEEAIEWADRTLHAQPRHLVTMRLKLVCLAHLGRTDDASEWLKRVLALQPALTIAGWKASYAFTVLSPELLALYTDGLRKAGVPEE